jgi:hypothetical protein
VFDYDDVDVEYCFVCLRCTDHFAEHDDLVAAGLATYDGSVVRRTEKWDDARAREIADLGFVAYSAGFTAYSAFCTALLAQAVREAGGVA